MVESNLQRFNSFVNEFLDKDNTYKQQIEKILEECGRADEQGLENAKWLFANELPVNEATLEKLDVLEQIAEKMTPDKVLEQIVFAMMAGASPKDAVLDDREFVIARDVIDDFQKINDNTVLRAAELITEQQQENQATDNHKQEIVVNLEFLRNMQEQEDASAVKENVVIPVVYREEITPEEVQQVTLKRQLEEIRQKMTLQAAVTNRAFGRDYPFFA